jgi:hypothetical protein
MRNYLLLKAAVITVIIFSVGMFLGMWMDGQRYEEIKNEITSLNIDWNDARLQSLYYQTFLEDDDSCSSALEVNKKLTEKIFSFGERLEKYERINRFSEEVLEQKKVYTLLHFQLWLNSISLKKKCNADYNTIIYFYSHYATGIEEEQQDLQSSVLIDAIHRCDGNLIVFPIPLDMDIQSIDLIKAQFGIKSTPTILINEQTVLEGVQDTETIKQIIGC